MADHFEPSEACFVQMSTHASLKRHHSALFWSARRQHQYVGAERRTATQTWEAAVPAVWSIPAFAWPWAESMPDLAAS